MVLYKLSIPLRNTNEPTVHQRLYIDKLSLGCAKSELLFLGGIIANSVDTQPTNRKDRPPMQYTELMLQIRKSLISCILRWLSFYRVDQKSWRVEFKPLFPRKWSEAYKKVITPFDLVWNILVVSKSNLHFKMHGPFYFVHKKPEQIKLMSEVFLRYLLRSED